MTQNLPVARFACCHFAASDDAMSDDDGTRPQRGRVAPHQLLPAGTAEAEEKKADEPDEPDAKPDEPDAGEGLCYPMRR